MQTRGLSFDAIPPLSVPLRFFLIAPWLGVLAALLLLAQGGEPLLNRWLPATLAATHLLTIGFMLSVMVGALLQLVPVLLGAGLPGMRYWAGPLHLALLIGALALAAGLAWGLPGALKTALFTLVPALALFMSLLGARLMRHAGGSLSLLALRLAGLALLLTVVLGAVLTLGHAWPGRVPGFRLLTDLHAVWAGLGWTLLLVMAVAVQVIPMFHVARPYPRRLITGCALALFCGLLLVSLGRYLGAELTLRLGASLSVVAGAVFVFSSVRLLYQRRRRAPDPGLYYWYLAFAQLAVALALGGVLAWSGEASPMRLQMLLGVLVLPGFAVTVIAGMLHKIVAFLVWFHLQQLYLAHRLALRELPTMYTLIAPRAVKFQFALHAGASILLPASLWLGGAWQMLALALLAAAFAVLGVNVAAAARRFRHHARGLVKREYVHSI